MGERDHSPIERTRMLFRNQVTSSIGGVRDGGYIKGGAGVPGDSRVLDWYALVYLVHGAGTYRDEHGEQPLGPGDFITVFPGVPHWYRPLPGQAFDSLVAIFEGPAFDAWVRAGILDPRRAVTHLEPVDYWLTVMDRVLGDGNDGTERGAIEEVLRLQGLLLRVNFAHQAGEGDPAWVERAKLLLDVHRNAHRVAAELGLPYETFRKRFSRLTGTTPHRFRAGLLIDEACRALATEDSTVREIAARLGFADEYHFSRRFKQSVGVSPTVFRARYR